MKWWKNELERVARKEGLKKCTLGIALTRIANSGLNLTLTGLLRYEALDHEEHKHRFPDEGAVRDWVDRSMDLCGISDHEGQVIYLNAAWREFTGKSFEDGEGIGWKDTIHPDDLATLARVRQEAFQKQQSYSVEQRVRAADGSYRWVRGQCFPYFIDKQFSGFIGALHVLPQKAAAEKVKGMARTGT